MAKKSQSAIAAKPAETLTVGEHTFEVLAEPAAHTITIGGQQFNVPRRYAAGHVCTEGEAHALNQTMAENVRNNLAGKAKDGKLTQSDVDAYVLMYQFGGRSGGFASRDPVEAEALEIARRMVRRKTKGLSAAQVSEQARALLIEQGDHIRAMAAQLVG